MIKKNYSLTILFYNKYSFWFWPFLIPKFLFFSIQKSKLLFPKYSFSDNVKNTQTVYFFWTDLQQNIWPGWEFYRNKKCLFQICYIPAKWRGWFVILLVQLFPALRPPKLPNFPPFPPSPVLSSRVANELPRRDPSIPIGSQLSMTCVTKYGLQWPHQPELVTG